MRAASLETPSNDAASSARRQRSLFNLTSMGFDAQKAEKALIANGWNVENALDDLMAEKAIKEMDDESFGDYDDDDEKAVSVPEKHKPASTISIGRGGLKTKRSHSADKGKQQPGAMHVNASASGLLSGVQGKAKEAEDSKQRNDPENPPAPDIFIPDAHRVDDIISAAVVTTPEQSRSLEGDSADSSARRNRLLFIAGSVLLCVVVTVGAIVATLVAINLTRDPTPSDPDSEARADGDVGVQATAPPVATQVPVNIVQPTLQPANDQTAIPTKAPSELPTSSPTRGATPSPSRGATPSPTKRPTPDPTKDPTPDPTKRPTPDPTKDPTPDPTKDTAPDPTNPPTPSRPLPVACLLQLDLQLHHQLNLQLHT